MTRPGAEPTNAELGRRMDTVNASVQDGFRRIAVEFEHMNLRIDKYVLIQVHEVVTASLERRIEHQGEDFDRQLKDIRDEFDGLQLGRRFAITTLLTVVAALTSIAGVIVAVATK